MRLVLFFFSIGFGIIFSACSSAPVLEKEIRQIDAHHIRVRRPVGESADPKAGPGGIDFQSQPLPNSQLDCQKLEDFLSGISLPAVSQCLIQLQNLTDQKGRFELEYELLLSSSPEWVLTQDEDRPNCLNQALPNIPVPREIIYVAESPEQKTRWCYSSRLPVGKGEVLGLKLSNKGQKLVLQFPLVKVPENESELRRTLSAWVLTPFFYVDREGVLGGTVVTDQLCRACFQGEDPLKSKPQQILQDPTKNLWP